MFHILQLEATICVIDHVLKATVNENYAFLPHVQARSATKLRSQLNRSLTECMWITVSEKLTVVSDNSLQEYHVSHFTAWGNHLCH